MAEPLELPHDLVDRLSDLARHALGVEMAILGSASICREERDALDQLATSLANGIRSLRDEVEAQHDAKGESKQ